MLVDYKVLSRDHKRSIRVEDALVDPRLPTTVMPLGWLEQLRSPSLRLPTGYYCEEATYVTPGYLQEGRKMPSLPASTSSPEARKDSAKAPNAIRAGPVVVYITGQSVPVVLNPYFVKEEEWGWTDHTSELDLRVGMDAIEQCSLFAELRPGGLLYHKMAHDTLAEAYEPVQDTLRRYGMKCGLAESPLVPRPWLRMRYMFIDELQRGPKLTEFVGHNPRSGTQWRFSQHTRYFRQGIWRETVRRNEMHDGLHAHSSWQKSPQQSVPEISFMAPGPQKDVVACEASMRVSGWLRQRSRMAKAGPVAHLLSPFGQALHGFARGSMACFAEPLDAWLSVLADSVPFYKDCLLLCPSSMSEQRAQALWHRARVHIPSAHIATLKPRRANGLAADDDGDRKSQDQCATSSALTTSTLPALISPLETLPPSSLDLVVFASNVFADELLFDNVPWHVSMVHRVLRPHGVMAILGYVGGASLVAPTWAREDGEAFMQGLAADARSVEDALRPRLAQPASPSSPRQAALWELHVRLRHAREADESAAMMHADVYLPFTATRRRGFGAEYALTPAQLIDTYRALPVYQLLDRADKLLSCVDNARVSGDSCTSCSDFVDLHANTLQIDALVNGGGDGGDCSSDEAQITSGVQRRRSLVDPLEVLQYCLQARAGAVKTASSATALRAEVQHFVVTCSNRSINQTAPSYTLRSTPPLSSLLDRR